MRHERTLRHRWTIVAALVSCAGCGPKHPATHRTSPTDVCGADAGERRDAIIDSICAAQLEPGVFIIASGPRCGVPASADAKRVLDALPAYPRFYNGVLDLIDRWVAESPGTATERVRQHLAGSTEFQEVLQQLLGSEARSCPGASTANQRTVPMELAVRHVALHVWPLVNEDNASATVYICSGANGETENALEDPDPILVRFGFLTAYYGTSFHALAEQLSGESSGSVALDLARLPPDRRLDEMSDRIGRCVACLREICGSATRFEWLFGVHVSGCDADDPGPSAPSQRQPEPSARAPG